ncbi:MAG: hypothetical protein FGM57_00835 [Candidatus Taylorbacteria bacterium]|nr:hypothetical protein [Candidatus Taylorbacteria bacterium]
MLLRAPKYVQPVHDKPIDKDKVLVPDTLTRALCAPADILAICIALIGLVHSFGFWMWLINATLTFILAFIMIGVPKVFLPTFNDYSLLEKFKTRAERYHAKRIAAFIGAIIYRIGVWAIEVTPSSLWLWTAGSALCLCYICRPWTEDRWKKLGYDITGYDECPG